MIAQWTQEITNLVLKNTKRKWSLHPKETKTWWIMLGEEADFCSFACIELIYALSMLTSVDFYFHFIFVFNISLF